MRRLAVLLPLLAGCGDDAPPLSVLVFTRENMWTHASNPVAADALQQLGDERGWQITVTADQNAITDEVVARTDVVVFSVTSGPVLDAAQRDLLEPAFAAGLGFVGTHSASATEADWPFYRQMIPVTFLTHPVDPSVIPANIDLLEPADPLLAGVPDPWPAVDEFYTFNERPEDIAGLKLLYAVDEASNAAYPDNTKVGFHPLAFTNETVGNRVFYTALGHTPEEYSTPEFMTVLERAILWAGAPRHERR